MKRLIFSLVIATGCSLHAFAQQSFVEGEITYKVHIEQGDPAAPVQKSEDGTLVIRLKGNRVVKELKLNSGFNNTMLLDGDKSAYSLRKIGNARYAIQLAPSQIAERRSKCTQMELTNLPVEANTIAGFRTLCAKLVCNDAGTHTVYYTKDWTISSNLLFEQFPRFGYLPLKYEIKNEKGATMRFTLSKIESKPLDNTLFLLPDGYKVISSEEYRSWNH
ncbi:MAG: hypothetical protein QM743_12540 [Chitinophagaceae bacterium]